MMFILQFSLSDSGKIEFSTSADASFSDLIGKLTDAISGDSGPKAVTGASLEELVLTYVNEAPGIREERCDSAVIDYSNASDGYIMVQYTQNTDRRIRVQVHGPEETYPYTIVPGEWAALPLSEGSGSYRVTVLENIEGTKYAQVLSCAFDAVLTDEFGPFLRSNLYVNYANAPNSDATAVQLTEGITDMLEKVAVIYDFVINRMTYDKQLAATVTSGYISDMDYVLEKKTGICFDYASLMTGMLRYVGVPCRMIFGYAGDVYHAWISVWVEGEGWIDNIIRFNGSEWQRMDPTFASANSTTDVVNYVGNGANYIEKYFY